MAIGFARKRELLLTLLSPQALPPKLRLRLRITYAKDGSGPVTEQVDWTEP